MDSARKFSPDLFSRALSQVSVIFAVDGPGLPATEVEAAWLAAGGSPFERDVPTTDELTWSVLVHEPAAAADGGCHPDTDPYAICVRTLPPGDPATDPLPDSAADPTHEVAVLALVAYGCVHAREAFHHQLRRALALTEQLRQRGHAAIVWYDEAADRFAPLAVLEFLASAPCCPSLRDTFTINARGGDRSSWLYTHGLERLGLPELEMLGLHGQDLELASLLTEVIAEQWLAHGVPAPRAPFSVTLPAVELTWEPSDRLTALARSGDRPSDDDDRPRRQPQRRAVVMPVRAGRPPTRAQMRGMPALLRRLRAEIRAICYSEHETERQSLAALHRLPQFLELARHARDQADSPTGRWRFLTKLGFGNEHLWFEVLEVLGKDRVRARLTCRPIHTRGLVEGQVTEQDLRRRLTGWRIERPGLPCLDADDIIELETLRRTAS